MGEGKKYTPPALAVPVGEVADILKMDRALWAISHCPRTAHAVPNREWRCCYGGGPWKKPIKERRQTRRDETRQKQDTRRTRATTSRPRSTTTRNRTGRGKTKRRRRRPQQSRRGKGEGGRERERGRQEDLGTRILVPRSLVPGSWYQDLGTEILVPRSLGKPVPA